jgi:S-DNA-T family DNA segregation ATPase FtsK/SpoIIIE
MLLLHNESPKPSRVQGTLVYDQEIDQIVEFWLHQEGPPVALIDLGEPPEIENADDFDAHMMEEVGARNIEGYNKRAKEKMPFLVLIVDELADLMMVGGFEVEQNLVRLAQLGRATGIHLVLATQRPSVNVVTGLLKANVPARAAFAVASQVDSRVILDAVGAEKLLGKGDMLLLHNESPKPSRVQGTLVYDQEIDQIVEFWLNQEGPPVALIDLGEPPEDENADDLDAHMMEEARELAARNPQLTESYLERRLKIGRSKAEEVMELLEEEGYLDVR